MHIDPDEFDSINVSREQAALIDENGVHYPQINPVVRMLSAEALSMAVAALLRPSGDALIDVENHDAAATLQDILVQRGCEELSGEENGWLTHVIDLAVYG